MKNGKIKAGKIYLSGLHRVKVNGEEDVTTMRFERNWYPFKAHNGFLYISGSSRPSGLFNEDLYLETQRITIQLVD